MDFKEEVNIWELGPKINIKINKKFLEFINNEINNQFINKKNIHKILNNYYEIPFSTFKTRINKSYPYFIDLEIIIHLCKILNIPLKNLQNNIIAYKSRKGNNYIKNPILPIKITPIFDMLIAHHIADGNVIHPKNRIPYFSYRQYNNKYRNLYIKKIELTFGKLKYKIDYFNKINTTRIYFPVACSDSLFSIYNLTTNNFKSKTARIPKEIYYKDWQYQLAFLIGIIIDDGHIDSNLILINLNNKRLIKDLHKLCKILKYKSTITIKGKDTSQLYILSEGTKKLYYDYKILLNEFPEVNLGYKGKRIEEFINRLNKPKIYIPGNKNKIIQMLKKHNLSVNEIAKKLNMTRQGSRYLIKQLKKRKK